ncbi:FAD-binding oxidoreductase [Leifsonia kafniensis]|uniref:FAD-binding oxidoreductase n=1 Tax=Leifsonia kafniensis TaxID=475957 RepID=A0ABP7K6Q6_9MICO
MSDQFDPLRENVRGRVIVAQDADYEEARAVYNGSIDKHPAAIVRVGQVADVMATVNFAHEAGLDVAIRSGGHSAPGFGTCDGGIVIDFAARNGVRVDPETQTARSEPGATWADFNHATHAFGLATTGGIIGSTGVTGLTLGGGIGYLARQYGLSCDNLLSADVVTADGRFLIANAEKNADLFWALRGGGGNFGVVTSLEFQLHPVKMIYGGVVIFSAEHAVAVGEFYRDLIASAPEELGVFLGFHQGPPVPFLPEEWHGKPVCVIVGAWTGDPAEGPARWQPILDAAPVLGSFVGTLPYPALNTLFDPMLPKGLQAYWKADFLAELSDDALNVAADFGSRVPSLESANHYYPINGAVQRVGADETAFAYRNVSFAPVIAGMWPDPADNPANIAWVKEYWTALHKYSEAGGYINFMDADDQIRVADNYQSNYSRLAQVKATYDPDNFFHINQNITPALR